MHVEIDAESKKWIESKGSQITVKILETKTCCAPGVQEVVAVPGKPKTTDQFTELNVEDLSIYVQKILCNKEKLSLKLSGISFLKTLAAKLQ
jgi:hypothetical protein